MQVLLVEDNQADAELLKEFFAEKQGAPHINWVTDGRDALDYVFQRGQFAQAQRPDVILLDLGLPRISGYEALKELKQRPAYSTIPVIILTTSRNPLDRTQCNALGADAFFSKPHNLSGYEELIRQLMNSEFPRLANHMDGSTRQGTG